MKLLRLAVVSVVCAFVASAFSRTSGAYQRPAQAGRYEDNRLPARFSDQEYWKLMSDFSEPNGNFRSDNLVSNEIRYQDGKVASHRWGRR